MKLPRRTFLRLIAAAAALRVNSSTGWAQAYPAHPVRVLVPFAPGGQVDVVARLIAQRLSEQLGQQFYVENAPGGGGTIGTGRAVQAAPDGHTILVQDGIAFTANPSLYRKVPYDPTRDFDPVTIPATTMQVLAVHPSIQARSIEELVALIKGNPGKYSYASPGTGTPGHLVGEQFRLSLGLDLVHVPFNSAGLAVGASVAGHTPICFASPSPAAQQVVDGRLRGLAVTSKSRSQALPDVPTMAEAGYAKGGDGFWVHPTAGRFEAELTVLQSPQNENEMHVMAASWRQAGFDVCIAEDASAGIDVPNAGLFQARAKEEAEAAGVRYAMAKDIVSVMLRS
jgi:tripartite-type tricarboxylate transporter receptor subunit TctC